MDQYTIIAIIVVFCLAISIFPRWMKIILLILAGLGALVVFGLGSLPIPQ